MEIDKIAEKVVSSHFISADEMEEYCPVCASQIRAGEYQITRADFEEELGIVAADKWKKMPDGWTDASRKEYWDTMTGAVKHKVTKCIKEMTGNVDDPGAFCASLADRVEPGWRSKKSNVTDVKEEVPVEDEPSHTDETLKPPPTASIVDRIVLIDKIATNVVTALNKQDLVMISDLSKWKAYFVDKIRDADGLTDRSAMESALQAEDTITMGRVIITPAQYFSNKDKANLKEHGLGVKFDV